MTKHSQVVAQALLAAGVVGFAFDAPRKFKSGIVSPIYLDNRKLLMHPRSWRVVIDAMRDVLSGLRVQAPVIAGIETAGIPHSAALAYATATPTVFVRKEAKGHGLGQRIEGGDVSGRNVILIEDQITTGGSVLSGIHALRDAGAVVEHCIAIGSYGFSEADAAFERAAVKLHVLVPFDDLLEGIRSADLLTNEEGDTLKRWLADPTAWSASRDS